ncbi:hypothetical protein fugu_000415 [Takifugu bimaculatus]|uniref:Uncharacterized protein n=1 Tax=Takifugu bimaculatus TaxID=433685 RepID=A0A4Z2CGM3_9TELE|nr:hypothetical protein fugu_000415 [Takifugu bimaculatus]
MVVSAGGEAKRQAAMDTSEAPREPSEPPQTPRRQTPMTSPPGAPMFTFHVYALLDRKFRFNRELDQLILVYGDEYFVLHLTHFTGEKQGLYLVEAKLLVEEKLMMRGQWFSYRFGIKQRQKHIIEFASRHILIPPNQNIKELHIYEGFIGRQEERSLWKSSLQLVGLNKSKADEVSNDWHLSVKHLLCRIFQKWSPAEKLSTDNLCNDLIHFSDSLGSADTRVVYPDRSHPPTIMASELITETLIRILRREPKEEMPDGVREASPLVLGLSVFMIARKLSVDLGVKGWAELCLLLSP